MIGTHDTYYDRPEVSNSDLSSLMTYFQPPAQVYDLAEAYRFGNLIDAMITEPHRVDYLRRRVDNERFSAEEWSRAEKMKKAFLSVPFCAELQRQATGQNSMSELLEIEHAGIRFSFKARCKWDLWMPSFGWGGDIKSTTATNQKQFEQTLDYFNYDRQRAWYMDISNAPKDVLIGISKVNFKVFIVTIERGGEIYNRGRAKYEEAAFKYWYLFENFKL